MTSKKNFNYYAELYDAFYKNKDYEIEIENLLKRLRNKGFKKFNTIIEFGCGTGSYSKILSENCVEIISTDLSSEMIEIAKNRLKSFKNIKIEQADLTKIKKFKTSELIISLFHVFSYLNSLEELEKAMDNVSLNLKKNGIFVFDFWCASGQVMNKLENRIKKVNTNELSVIKKVTFNHLALEEIVKVYYEFEVYKNKFLINTFNEVHSMKYWSLETIKLVLDSKGFKIIDTFDIISGSRINNDSWGATIIARKL